MNKLKVMTVLGTRPEIIRLSRVISMLNRTVEHKLIHTGQNYDYELNEIFFKDLELPKPDYFLDVKADTLGNMLGNILISVEKVFAKERPDAVLILGDTNSSIAGILAKRMKIPLYHMEAGNRCFDQNVPEEINRRIIDHISDFNLVYTEHARRHLISEGLPHRHIYLTGSPLKEVLDYYADAIESSKVLDRLKIKARKYFLASIHREENVDNTENLSNLLAALEDIWKQYKYPIIISTHPRTRKRVESLVGYQPNSAIHFVKPFGFLDYNKLQKNAFCVLSDSGSISEESAILSFPAVTMRNSMERPEGLDSGGIIITGLDSDIILQAIETVTSQHAAGMIPTVPFEYQISNVSQRVTNLIIGTAKLCHTWTNVFEND
ncbi:MAG: UDP-N-acetylglucosamine 2-epimerase (non-hydrolyzing) [Nitrospinota bacterium]|nr:UDP-N-acetylglucosamine 2-epimerase (non-hydrolyzing) [Nitrospinota bacterium]